jgi:hypothetical protein
MPDKRNCVPHSAERIACARLRDVQQEQHRAFRSATAAVTSQTMARNVCALSNYFRAVRSLP